MQNVIIKRCPANPFIVARGQEVTAALGADFGIQAQVQSGAKGEFTVLVDGVPMIQRNGDNLPSIDEVEAAVRNAGTPAPSAPTV